MNYDRVPDYRWCLVYCDGYNAECPKRTKSRPCMHYEDYRQEQTAKRRRLGKYYCVIDDLLKVEG